MNESVAGLVDRLAQVGLNHWGVVSTERYDATARDGVKTGDLFPDARSILVFASGGTALWDAFTADLTANPSHLVDEQHPLDAFVMRAVNAGSQSLQGLPHRWFYAAAEAKVHLDFRTLAVTAGIGVPSRLGLVIDETYGPWLGLRAACMLPISLPETEAGVDLCSPCASPCISACPGSALVGGQWSVEACASFHRTSDVCATQCDARGACPLGDKHRYSRDQVRYHNNREVGRRELAQMLNIEDKIFKGIGPLWADWSG